MKIAFFANTYPAPSATFIRRKIEGLEALGVEVARFSTREFGEDLVESADRREANLTDVLTRRRRDVLSEIAHHVVGRPRRLLDGTAQAWQLADGMRDVVRHGAYLGIAQRLAMRLRALQVEHLHAYFDTSTTVALLAHRITGIPFSFTVTGPEQFQRSHHARLAQQIRSAAFVTAVSEDGMRNLRAIAEPRDHAKLHLVRDIAEPTWLEAPSSPLPQENRLSFIGRLVPRKGPLDLIEAMHRLQAKGRAPTLEMVGDGPQREQVNALINRHGLHDHVRVLGWGNAELVRTTIERSKALVLPSFAEGLPVVLMEAFARGRPVITTPVAGIPELVEPGVSGWLVPPGDPAALADALDEMLGLSTEQLTRMAERGRERTKGQHSSGPLSEQLYALIRGER